MALPPNVGYSTITGRFIRAILDGVDADKEPDGIPIPGLTVTFTANITPAIVRNPTASPPVTIIIDPVTATTNNEGVLVGIDGVPGLTLVASDDPDLDPYGWTYTATIVGTNVPRSSFSFVAPAGQTIDLGDVIPVPASPGGTLQVWQTTMTTAVSAKNEAVAARNELVGMLEAGGVGSAGKSAYQIAVDAGFVGTQSAWLDSLKGSTGTSGTITSVTASGLAAGATPTVTLGGTSTSRTIALGIPAGAAGAAGTITSVTATPVAAGASPTVTIGGTPSARTIELGVPAGAAGPVLVDASVYNGTSWPAVASTAKLVFYDSRPYPNAPNPPTPPGTAVGVWDYYIAEV